MKSGEYWDEFTHLVMLAVAITFFVIAFKGLGKIVTARLPWPGLRDALAGA